MKKIILIIGIITMIIAAEVAFGQTSDGVITYEVRINVHRTLPADREGMKEMVPEFRIFKQQLFYNADESLYKPLIEEEDDQEMESGGNRFRHFRPKMEIYSNQGTGKITSLQDFMGKNYIISDSVKVDPWKLGTEVKTIQGYECKQAFYTRTTMFNNEERKQVITAWYTDKLRPFLGPERYNTLPGAVLAVDIDNGERVLVATKLELRALKKNELKEPANGEKTTQAEFIKMRDERIKSMRSNGANVIIRN